MDFIDLFPIQEKLDSRIRDMHLIEKADTYEKTILALMVEVGEMANETRTFKFWSTKLPSEKHVILEEFVDCLHFMISIGNHHDFYEKYKNTEIEIADTMKGDLTDLLTKLFESITTFRIEQSRESYLVIWDYYMSIAKKLNFSVEDIKQAYMDKNKENHERQDNGY